MLFSSETGFEIKDAADDEETGSESLRCGSQENKERDMTNVTTKTVTRSADSIVSREVNGEEKDLLKVPISSTVEDRDGDEFSERGLKSMRGSVKSEKPLVFLNHGFVSFGKPLYDASEFIGTQVDAEIEDHDDSEGEKVLNAYILPNKNHEEGMKMMQEVDDGHAVKFSVGFRILDDEEKDSDEEEPGLYFHDADLMETSKVGIPSNPAASAAVDVAAKSASISRQLDEMGVEISDEEAFAKALASELISGGEEIEVGSLGGVDHGASTTHGDFRGREVVVRGGDGSGTETRSTLSDGTSVGTWMKTGDNMVNKAPEDIDPQDWANLLASHWEGADPDDFVEAWEGLGEYVGEADLDAVASFVGDVVGEETGTVLEQFDDWMEDMEEEDDKVAELEEEASELRSKLDEDDVGSEESKTESPEPGDGEDNESDEKSEDNESDNHTRERSLEEQILG